MVTFTSRKYPRYIYLLCGTRYNTGVWISFQAGGVASSYIQVQGFLLNHVFVFNSSQENTVQVPWVSSSSITAVTPISELLQSGGRCHSPRAVSSVMVILYGLLYRTIQHNRIAVKQLKNKYIYFCFVQHLNEYCRVGRGSEELISPVGGGWNTRGDQAVQCYQAVFNLALKIESSTYPVFFLESEIHAFSSCKKQC